MAFNGVAASVLSADPEKLVAEVPEGASSGAVTLQVAGHTAKGPQFTILTEGPVIEAVTPARGGEGTRVTITGDHFLPASVMAEATGDNAAQETLTEVGDSLQADVSGVTLKAGPQPSARINGLPVSVSFGQTLAPLLSLSNTEIIVEVPEGATGGIITLIVGDKTATSSSFTLIRPPAISEVRPTAGPVGTEVTISGHYFSVQPDSNQVTFNGIRAEITSADTARLTVTVPGEATTGLIEVITNGQATTGPTFTVSEAPVPQIAISDITPKQGPVGTEVTISGTNFGSTKAENTVTFNGTKATITSASKTELVATVPNGATNGPVNVTTNGQTATGPSFTVTADPDKQLAINDLSPKEGPVGTSVTITGANFSATAAENTVTFNGTEATVSNASTTELVVTVPQGATTGSVNVQVGNQTAEGPTFTVTEAPMPQVSIDDISPKEGPVGTSVTITGENFGSTKAANTVTFNGTEAAISSASETELVATVPEGATTGAVEVTVDGQTATGPTFTVTETPVPQVAIDNISPKEGPVGTEVTISGTNFSATAAENTVTFNGTEATISSASATELVVSVPADATSGPVQVTVGNQTATGPNFNITENQAPTITSDASFSVDENTTAVTTIVATDPEGDALTYTISGGADADAFTISNSGKLAFKTAPDFENPGDGNGDNVYEVTVQVSDGAQSVTQPVSVAVQNVAEAPGFFRGRITTDAGDNYYAYGPDFVFDPVPAGTRLIDRDGVQHFFVTMSDSVEPITSATLGGPGAAAFSIEYTDGGYYIYLSGPTLEHSESPYEFSITAQNAAGQTTTQTFTIPVQSPFAGGSGTAGDPYEVATLEQLQAVGQYLDAHFIQTADIDASATAGWNSRSGFEPIGKTGGSANWFTGSYDGDGHAITGLTIDRPGTKRVGLFGYIGSGAEITDVALTGLDITGDFRVGGLAGNNGGTITGSYADGKVIGDGNTGGLVGDNSGTITNSRAAVTVSGGGSYATGGLVGFNRDTITRSYATGDVTGSSSATGGLVGINSGSIETSYATGSVSGSSNTGGLVGDNSTGSIETSYATGSISGTVQVGGLVGFTGGNPVIDSYWDTTALPTSNGGTGLTTAQMQGAAAETNMTGFDFTNVWQTNAGDYPTLRGNPEP